MTTEDQDQTQHTQGLEIPDRTLHSGNQHFQSSVEEHMYKQVIYIVPIQARPKALTHWVYFILAQLSQNWYI